MRVTITFKSDNSDEYIECLNHDVKEVRIETDKPISMKGNSSTTSNLVIKEGE